MPPDGECEKRLKERAENLAYLRTRSRELSKPEPSARNTGTGTKPRVNLDTFMYQTGVERDGMQTTRTRRETRKLTVHRPEGTMQYHKDEEVQDEGVGSPEDGTDEIPTE